MKQHICNLAVIFILSFACFGQDTNNPGGGGGGGTVTNTGGALTANAVVLGAGGSDTKVSTGITTNGASELDLGVSGTSGVWGLNGSTSGKATCTAPAIAGTSTNGVVCTNLFAGPGIVNASGAGGLTFSGNSLVLRSAATSATIFLQDNAGTNYFNCTSTICATAGSLFFNKANNVCRIGSPVTLSTTTTICTWTLPAVAQTWSYHCMGMYQTNTGSITLLLGTQFAQAPANSTHSAIIWSAASTQTYAQATNTGTTAVTTMTGVAPSANTATPWNAFGTFTSSATSGTFVLYGTASTATDAQINGGSSCEIF